MNRLWMALAIYAVLAVLAWFTLPDMRFRYMTIAFLAFFAIRTITAVRRGIEAEKRDEHQKDPDE